MDPRTGLDWLYDGSDLGQLRPVQSFRRTTFRPTSTFQKYDAFAVQSYELRQVGSPGTFASSDHWVRTASWSYMNIVPARSRIDTLCSYLKGHHPQHRTIVRLFGRVPNTGKWEKISACDVRRR